MTRSTWWSSNLPSHNLRSPIDRKSYPSLSLKPWQTLTPRQWHVAELVSHGLTNREISLDIGTSENMVKKYVVSILDKTGMGRRIELAVWYATEERDHTLSASRGFRTLSSQESSGNFRECGKLAPDGHPSDDHPNDNRQLPAFFR